jgi:hypothetical protein
MVLHTVNIALPKRESFRGRSWMEYILTDKREFYPASDHMLHYKPSPSSVMLWRMDEWAV